MLSDEVYRIERKIIDDFEDDATSIIDALIGYLQDIKSGNNEESAEDLYIVVERAIGCHFKERHTPINRFINSAIHWQAEQIAIEEEKLTRPTP